MPRESLDAPEDLPKEAPGQVTFGQLEDEVPSMPDEPPTGLEESLLETRQGPALPGSLKLSDKLPRAMVLSKALAQVTRSE